jgi:hypothetical protein
MKQMLIGLAGILCLCNASSAQEIGLFGIKSWTDHYEVQNPVGMGIMFSKSFVNNQLFIGLNYSYLQNSRKYTGRLISGFMLPEDISEIERIKSDSHSSNLDITISFVPLRFRQNDLQIGTGFIISEYEGQRRGLNSGLEKKLMQTTKFGFFVQAAYIRHNFVNPALSLIFALRYKQLQGSPLATDFENTFSNEFTMLDLKLGIVYSFWN